MGARGRKREYIECLAAVCMALVMLTVIWKVLGCFFETNDDRCIAGILSGNMGGIPDAHTMYVNYILSCPLSLLYKLWVRIPWYGLMLLSFHVLVYAALFQSAVSRGKTMVERVVSLGFVGSCILLNLYITVAVQYTSTAALMAVAGYICLLLNRSSKRGWFLFCFFESMSFLLRDQAMLMIQPMGMAVCTSEFFGAATGNKKAWLRKTGVLISVVAVIVAVGSLGTLLGYRGEGWSEYKRFNQAITALFDFYDTPKYEEVKDILDSYNVSGTEYAAFRQYVMLSQNISTECMVELAEYQKSVWEDNASLWEALRQIPKGRSREDYYGVGNVSVLTCVLVLVWLLLRRRGVALASLAAVFCSGMAVEGYLVYRGRLLQRVMLPLFFGEILFALVILLRDYTSRERSIPQRAAFCIIAGVFAAVCVSSGRMQYHSVRWERSWDKNFTEGLVEVYAYCRANPEKRYILEVGSFSDYRGSVLETRLSGGQNCIYSGGWFFHSPPVNDFQHRYLDNAEEICLILYNNEYGEEHYAVAFLAEALGEKPVLTDSFITSNGTAYLVWEFGR